MNQPIPKIWAVRRFPWERLIRNAQFPSRYRACKVVAYTLATYASSNGRDVRPGEKRLMLECQLSERTVRDALGFLRDNWLIYRHSRGSQLGRANVADVYQLSAPEDWRQRFYVGDVSEIEPWEEEPKAA